MRPNAPPDVLALSPVACALVPWRIAGAAGGLRVTVVVKATFAIVPDHEAPLVEPAPLEREDRYLDQDPARSLRRGSDLAPYIPGAGVVLIGHAYAPSGSPVTGLSARLAIYGAEALLDKTVHVYGDVPAGGSAPAPFHKMPLVYERAYGGASVPSNPVGVGLPGTRRPNLVHPTNPHRPAGFGPIAPRWPARRRLFTERGLEARPGADEILELPAELDFRAFHAAPGDQQLPSLGGEEWIVLDNLRAGQARVKTRLPSARARARWHLVTRDGGRAGAEQEVELVADTLGIDTDLQTAALSWRGSFALDRPELLAQVRAVAGLELPGQPIAWPDRAAAAGRAAGRAAPDPLAGTGTGVMSPFARPALPFEDQESTIEGPSPLRARPVGPSPELTARMLAGEMPDDPSNRTGPMMAAKLALPALPFGPPPAPPPSVTVRMPAPERTALVSMTELAQQRAERAPFVMAAPSAQHAEEPPIPGAPWSAVAVTRPAAPEESTVVQPRAPEPPMAPPLIVAPPPPVILEREAPVPTDAVTSGARARAQAKLADGGSFDDDDLEGADLSELDFTGRSLRRCKLRGARLAGAVLEGARLTDAQLQDADLTGARLDGAELGGADLTRARGEGANLEGASLRRADLRHASFPRASFAGAVMCEVQADQGDFTGARFERADLAGASFRKARLVGAVLAHATLDGTDLRNADLERANVHATTRRTTKMAGANTRDLDEKPPERGE